jgi:hypothetical protein
MTPKQYLDRYTYLSFFSPWNNEQVNAPVVGYGSGWGKRGSDKKLGGECQAEFANFVRAMRVAHHGNPNTPCGARFFFKGLGLISPDEEFYPETFTHAFDGKGSPDEIIDTLRIAMAVGRIGLGNDRAGSPAPRYTAADYTAKFLTLDCNGLVGNYYGAGPSLHIKYYANPSRRRSSVNEVRVGDCVVTHSATSPYEHIALIEGWEPRGSQASVRLVEWGQAGGEDKHYSQTASVVEVGRGGESSFGVGWSTTSNIDGLASFRYVFAPMPGVGNPYGWS